MLSDDLKSPKEVHGARLDIQFLIIDGIYLLANRQEKSISNVTQTRLDHALVVCLRQ
jgi:hypothetical protein